MAVKTKCVRDPVDIVHDGLRVMIARYWSKGVNQSSIDMRCIALAPSEKLVNQWLHLKRVCKKNNDMDLLNMGWNDFKNKLLNEFNSNQPQFSHLIEMLRRINTHSNVTLLCNEKNDDPYCHRYMVKELIEF
jgi:uncharacterized protein YeaO (DUF488 family)